MITGGTLNLTADRFTPFIYSIEFTDVDFTGATMEAQVRLRRNAAGDPLVDLDAAAAGTEGISFSVLSGDTTAILQIDEATIEGLAFAAEREDDAVFYWDLQITPSGGIKAVYLRGTFTVLAGVTQ